MEQVKEIGDAPGACLICGAAFKAYRVPIYEDDESVSFFVVCTCPRCVAEPMGIGVPGEKEGSTE